MSVIDLCDGPITYVTPRPYLPPDFRWPVYVQAGFDVGAGESLISGRIELGQDVGLIALDVAITNVPGIVVGDYRVSQISVQTVPIYATRGTAAPAQLDRRRPSVINGWQYPLWIRSTDVILVDAPINLTGVSRRITITLEGYARTPGQCWCGPDLPTRLPPPARAT